jgi:hypothetical protein
MLKPIVVDKTNFGPYEVPVEQRSCPSLEQTLAN